MKKLVLAPDSFKGTMSSRKVCAVMEREIRRCYPEAEVIAIPVADGGEGTVDCFLSALEGERVSMEAHGPLMEGLSCGYGLVHGGQTAVIEMAACAGLPLLEGRLDPLRATTYGVGEQLVHAARHGVRRIVVGLGGSATNDGGCGAACAAGVRFYNRHGEEFLPAGGTLKDIARIDASGLCGDLQGIEITAMCDIDNPLTGKTGAAHVFGPQKGADPDMVERLDEGLRHLAEVIRRDLGPDLAGTPGAGAAGGMGAGMTAFFGARLQSGIEAVLDTVEFDGLLRGADLVLTGEGKMDTQSLRGKVVVGVARRARAAGVPVAAVVGDIGDGIDQAYGLGVSGIFSINRVAVDFSEARPRAEQDLALTVENLMRFCQSMGL